MRELEDKFHGLELHHVLRDFNKAADIPNKTASSHKPVPNSVFACNQHAPFVWVDEEQPQEPGAPEFMEINQQPVPNLEDPEWRFPILE
jgi:hypothetical protein